MVQKRKQKPRNVLVVCHGNICRSPLSAAVLLREPSLVVRSSGFVNPNRPAAKKVRDWAKTAGYDLTEHRSRLTTLDDLEWAQVVLYMDGGNLKRLVALGSVLLEPKLRCLAEFGTIPRGRVVDPNYLRRDSPELEDALQSIVDCSKGFLRAHRKAPA